MSQNTNAPAGFDEMNLDPAVLAGVRDAGYTAPTPIQARTIPPMAAGCDLVGQARTGTGKTAAFALPLLSRIDLENRRPQVLVLAPTRELANQVAEAFKTYGSRMKGLNVLAIYGGQSYGVQLNQLKKGVHVVVGTPGRLMDHLRRKTLTLADLTGVVLDEADEMLHMGFIEDVEWILGKVPEDAQTALFSATMPPPIKKIAQNYLTDPEEIKVKSDTNELATITQSYWMVQGARKDAALVRFLEAADYDGVMVFTRTRTATIEVTKTLEENGFRAEALNGDMAQAARERTVERLKSGRIDILVATDVAARGLDVDRISHVINYDMADKIDPYIHRIGRTGRAGRSGEALLFLSRRERWLVKRIQKATGQELKEVFLPTAKEINTKRVARFKDRITQVLDTHGANAEGTENSNGGKELELFKSLIQAYVEETNAPALDVAAALAKMAHGKTDFYMSETRGPKASFKKERFKKDRRERRDFKDRKPGKERRFKDRDDRREDRREKRAGQAPGEKKTFSRPLPPPEKGMERYRIKVGRAQGIKAGDVVGAISNESGLEGKFIRNVTIHHDHSLVDLPFGMPKAIFTHLKRVRLRQHQMDIARA